MASSLPPALKGLPLLGNYLGYRRDRVGLFRRGYDELGPIFSIRLGPQRAAVLIGPDYHRFFFEEADRTLSLPEVYRFVVPMFGGVLNAARDERTRRAHLDLLHSAFRGARMQGYIKVMEQEVSDWLDTLGAGGDFEIYETFAGLGMRIAASAFLGRGVRGRMDEFLPLFHDLARGMDFILPPDLPLPRFQRRDVARRRLYEMIRPVFDEHRACPGRHGEFLQAIVDAGGRGEGAEADETAAGLALMTIFTGYIATAAQTCWSLILLLQHPHYLALIEQEREAILDDRPGAIDASSLQRLECLDRALKESQRLHPVMSHYARFNARSYELGGYLVPKGWLTMVCPAVAHRLPEVFADPDRFDPDRFAPGRAEDCGRPYSLIGFGAGLYRCPGAGFGTNEMKCILSLLLRRYTLELPGTDPGAAFDMGVTRPSPPYRVRYRSRMSPVAPSRPERDARHPRGQKVTQATRSVSREGPSVNGP